MKQDDVHFLATDTQESEIFLNGLFNTLANNYIETNAGPDFAAKFDSDCKNGMDPTFAVIIMKKLGLL